MISSHASRSLLLWLRMKIAPFNALHSTLRNIYAYFFLLFFVISSYKVLSLCKLLKFCHWTFFSLFVLHWTLFTAVYQQKWRTPNARNSKLNALTHNVPLRSLLLSNGVRYGLSTLYYTQVRRCSGRCLELYEQEHPGTMNQVRRRPEEKVCRRQPGMVCREGFYASFRTLSAVLNQ